MTYAYKFAILGGTFDHFHFGHEQFVTKALNRAEHITIGIVEKLLRSDKSFTSSIEDYSVRLASLTSFLHELQAEDRTTIIPINDIYGSSLLDLTIEAIFVTDATFSSAKQINIERQKIGLQPLEVEVIPFSMGDDGNIISSGRIRSGEIDRHGSSYLKFFLQKEKYLLPDDLRKSLQKPLGEVVTSVQDVNKIIPPSKLVITVGDIVSVDLQKQNFPLAISIIDYKTRRENLDKNQIEQYFPIVNQRLNNPAGTVGRESAIAIVTALSEYQNTKATQVIAVEGEEDLLALPALLLSPLGTYIIYGQYSVGMVVVEVTEEIKISAKHYLEEFN